MFSSKVFTFALVLMVVACSVESKSTNENQRRVKRQGCENGGIPPTCCENGSSSPYCCENESTSPYCCENNSPSPYCCENHSMKPNCAP